jgi:hypothetical protein
MEYPYINQMVVKKKRVKVVCYKPEVALGVPGG